MNVVITGATKGIGRAIAQAFAEGGNTIIAIARTMSDLNGLKANFIARFPLCNVQTLQADVANEQEIKAAAQWLFDNHLVPDILVNNAGFYAPGSIHNEAEGQLIKMMETNVYGAYHLTRALLPAMMARRSGQIFNICSVASLRGFDNVGAYGISKYALLGFSNNLREELKPHGIRVTAVMPGATYTNSWAGSDIDPARIMCDADVAAMVYAASKLSPQAVVEDMILRPQLGDL